MQKNDLDQLKLELSLAAKNGIDFIIAASIIWLIITYIWTLPNDAYTNSIYTFFAGGGMLPLAFGFSKILKTNWKVKDNPLQPLGLWLNFAQLFYFPFLFFILSTNPDYFVMAYVIITGAHFFPYAWFYDEKIYAVGAGIAAWGGFFLAMKVDEADMYLVPLFMAALLMILAIALYLSYRRKLVK